MSQEQVAPGPRVFTAIAAVMSDLAKEGIAKSSKNQQQGYSFRGIDAIYNELSPILARHNLLMLPRVLTREVTERTTQKGGALFYVVVEAEFDLICAEDSSKHTIRTFGEAMDSADKATNKAMSAAYKYAAMQAFCIPTEGDNDADATTHEVRGTRRLSAYRAEQLLKQDVLLNRIDTMKTAKGLDDLTATLKTDLAFIPVEWERLFLERIQLRRDELAGKPVTRPEVTDPGASMDEAYADTMREDGVDTLSQLKKSLNITPAEKALKGAKTPEDLAATWDAVVEGKFEGDAREYLRQAYDAQLRELGVSVE